MIAQNMPTQITDKHNNRNIDQINKRVHVGSENNTVWQTLQYLQFTFHGAFNSV